MRAEERGMVMENDLARDFQLKSLLRFALPTVLMNLFVGLYYIVDGVCVARFASTDALAAMNITYPTFFTALAISIMLATGGSAVVAKKMGEDREQEARADFTFLTIVTLAVGVLFSALCLLNLNPLLYMLGADDALLPMCRAYVIIQLCFTPAIFMQMFFQTFFVTAGKPNVGLVLTLIAGCINIVLDLLLVGWFRLGVVGASFATCVGYSIPAVAGMIFFFRRNKVLHFTKPSVSMQVLGRSCVNGSSEMVANLSTSITTAIFNIIMMKLIGADGVTAISLLVYTQYIFQAFFTGFSIGVAPIFSYNYGSGNRERLARLFRISSRSILAASIGVFLVMEAFTPWMVLAFAPRQTEVFAIAIVGIRIYSIAYLCYGTNVFTSALFTALSNGKLSFTVSFLRTLAFLLPGVLVLSHWLGATGVWLAGPCAEAATVLFAVTFLRKCGPQYGFLPVKK